MLLKIAVSESKATTNILTALVGLFAIGISLYLLPGALRLKSRESIINADKFSSRALNTGELIALYVKPQEIVKEGDLIYTILDRNSNVTYLAQLRSQLENNYANLRRLEEQRIVLASQATPLTRDAVNQSGFERARQTQNITRLQANLEQAIAGRELAKVTRDRLQLLWQEGAISQQDFDVSESELQVQEARVRAVEAEIQEANTNLRAVEAGLTLENTRSNFDPRTRLEEADIKIRQLDTEIEFQKSSIKALEKEISTIEEGQEINVYATRDGMVWQVRHRVGDTVQANDPVVELIDCKERWLDVYLSENRLRNVEIGEQVQIDLIGHDLSIPGKVEFFRSGLGRLQTGSDLISPIEQNVQKLSQIRVSLEFEEADPGPFCYVGFTATTTFGKK
jgi:multidrug resistance efflux pump